MSAETTSTQIDTLPKGEDATLFRVLAALSFCHLVNDMVQSLLPSIYPILKASFHLGFAQIGIITFTYLVSASVLQPLIGLFTDRRPMPYILPVGMFVTLLGLLLLAVAPSFRIVLAAALLVGIGSAIFHPESSRVAQLASGGRPGLAQSFFQVGGNSGSAIGPLLAAFIVLPRGQAGSAWFAVAVIPGILVLQWISGWYKAHLTEALTRKRAGALAGPVADRKRVIWAMAVLVALVFSKYLYLASLSTYYTFYLIEKFGVSVQNAQLHLFAFLAAVAAGTFIGGPIGDRIGRKRVIWCSILGVLPFSLALPYAGLFWTGILSVAIGFVIASAFSAILVYAHELVPGRIGMISGFFFGFAFGMGGIGAAVLGRLADMTSLALVFRVCSYLPAVGLLTGFLPEIKSGEAAK